MDYNGENILLSEQISLDSGEVDIERKVTDLYDVFGRVGGIQHLLVWIFAFFFKPYTMYTFRAEAINTFFTIKTSDKSLVKGQNKLKLSFCNKFRIIFGICPNIRLTHATPGEPGSEVV